MAKRTRASQIPQGAVLATIVALGEPMQCKPIGDDECDSWKTFGIAIIYTFPEREPVMAVHPTCQKHAHTYVDEVLFSKDTPWTNLDQDEDDDE